MITCRVKPGMRFGMLKQFGPGDLVEIPLSAFPGFKDKLERVYELPAFPSIAGEVLEDPEGEPEPDESEEDSTEVEESDENEDKPEPPARLPRTRRKTPVLTAEDV